jgi:uncharacterized repeat protein (TIGR01451 family)
VTTIATAADLALTKTGPAVVTAGTNLTYTLTLTNNGPSDAQTVSLTDATPAGTTFVSASSATGFTQTTPAVGGTGTVTETAPSMAAGATATFTIVVQATSSDANGSTITNTATVTSPTDTNTANNTATSSSTVVTSADLAVTKTGPATVTAGANVTYTITLTNNGPSDAANVSLSDTLPTGTTFVSETHPAGFTSTTPGAGGTGTVTENAATLAASGTATFTLVVKANSNLSSANTLSNTATVSSQTTDPSPGDNTSTTSAAISTSADLAVTKAGPATVTAGANVTYTVTLTNNGPSDSQGVSLTDAVPTNTTFVSETHPTGFSSTTPAVGGTGTITETTATFAGGSTATFTIVVKVNANAASASSISNTATVSATTTDPNNANNTSAVTSSVATSADMSVTKTGPAGPVDAGSPVTYTVAVTNGGPSDAQAVVVTDTVPAGATINSISFPQGSQGTGTASNTWNLGTVATGATVTGTVVVTFSNAGNETDTAAVSSSTSDPTPNNNSATATTVVQSAAFTNTAGVPVNGFEFFPLSNVPVATFSFDSGTHPASDFTAIINWGDNNTSAGTITQSNGTYTVSGSHNYTDERTYPVTVTVNQGTTSTTINTTAAMLEELLPGEVRGTADQRFLSEVYRDMLGRPIDANGLANWSGELAAGISRFQVVTNIQTSTTDEFRKDEVQAVYQQYLNRAADPQGLNDSVNFLKAGGTVEQLIAIIAASPEFNQHTNGTNDSWLDVFYQDALHRPVDASGRAAWDAQFAAGQTRTQVAAEILASDEYRMDLIQADYLRYLDRQPDPKGASDALAALKNGITDEQLIALIMTDSPEFYNKTAQ